MSVSVEAIAWALKQPVKHSSAKFVLVALANCANGHSFECWPSIAYLCEATAQNRKTVIENIGRLVSDGYISDTGSKKGRTGRIKTYILNTRTAPKQLGQPKTQHGKHVSSDDPHYGAGNHYVYRLTHRQTGQFYVGVRTCVGAVENDQYKGSGLWPERCKIAGVALEKEVVAKFETRNKAEIFEQKLIDESLLSPFCMNSPKTGTVQTVPETELFNSPKTGTIESEIVPKTDGNSTENGHLIVPKTGHGTVSEPEGTGIGSAPAGAPSLSVAASKKKNPVTFEGFCESIKASGGKPISPDDPIFEWAGAAGIPDEWLALAWSEFKTRYRGNGKRYADWRAVFRTAVRNNWFKFWRISQDGQYVLTTEGEMARRAGRVAA